MPRTPQLESRLGFQSTTLRPLGTLRCSSSYFDGLGLAADLIDQLEGERLAPREHAALLEARHARRLDVAPGGHQAHEPALGFGDHLLGDRPAGLVDAAGTCDGLAFSGPLLISFILTPSLSSSWDTSAHWKMTPTEPVMVLPRATMWSVASPAM